MKLQNHINQVNQKNHSSDKVPELRFPEFMEKWETRRLGDISKIERGKFTPRPRNNPIYYGGKIPFVQTGDVVNSNGIIESYSQTLNEKGLAVSKLFNAGTILITIAANIGYTGVLQIDMACPDSLIGISCRKNFNNYFINYLLSNEQSRMDRLAPAAAQKNINLEFLKPYTLIIPSKFDEQQKIASFLTAIDQRIQLLQQKKAKMEEYKKGVMQSIFCLNCDSCDFSDDHDSESKKSNQSKKSQFRLRFKDENGNDFSDWEAKKLEELVLIEMGQSPKSNSYNTSNIGMALIQGNADIVERVSNPRQFTDKPTKTCEVGDLLLTVRAPVGYVGKSNHNACLGRGVCAIKSLGKSDLEFIYQFLLWFEPKWIRIGQGSTFTAISSSDINSLKITIPSLPEQRKIASFLSSLDEQIEAVASASLRVQQYKKGLLQKMFV